MKEKLTQWKPHMAILSPRHPSYAKMLEMVAIYYKRWKRVWIITGTPREVRVGTASLYPGNHEAVYTVRPAAAEAINRSIDASGHWFNAQQHTYPSESELIRHLVVNKLKEAKL